MFSGGVLQIEQCATLEPSDVVTACYVQFLRGVENDRDIGKMEGRN